MFFYGEGRDEKNFLITLIDLKKFRDHTQKWNFNYSNASGCSPKDILEKCKNSVSGCSYDHILCFIDIDKLKQDYITKWKSKKNELEKKYRKYGIEIIWQMNKLEDEFGRVLENTKAGKKEINRLAKKNIKKFINSKFWNKILKAIKKREEELILKNK